MNPILEKLVSEYVNSRNIRQLEVEFLIQDHELDLVNKMRALSFNKTDCFSLLDEMVKQSRALIDSLPETQSLKDGVRYRYDIIELALDVNASNITVAKNISFKEVIEKLQGISKNGPIGLDVNRYTLVLREAVTEDITHKHNLSVPEFVNLFDLQAIIVFSYNIDVEVTLMNRQIKLALQEIEKDKAMLTTKVENLEVLMNSRNALMCERGTAFIDGLWQELFPAVYKAPEYSGKTRF